MKTQIDTRKIQNTNEFRQEQAFVPVIPETGRLVALTETNRQEVVEFLAKRPVHTVVMSSFIEDNGIESSDNRGRFYAYRNQLGKLEGVALIGHTTLVESRTAGALKAFALAARDSETPIHVMMSDGKTIESFWKYFAGETTQPRLVCTEMLFEVNFPFFVQQCKWDVRTAQESELEQIAEAHAEVAFIESGVNPMQKDREGFLKRCLSRIHKDRTFVVFEDDKLVFKADIVAETETVIYLEGVYVAPEYRGRGIGSECLSKLSLDLLDRVQHICLLSNVEFTNAHKSFVKAGFLNTDQCITIFV
jgi:uncharacterized protein